MISEKYKLLLIFYIIIVFFLILITLKDQKDQDMIEHFNYSVMKRKQRRKKILNVKQNVKLSIRIQNILKFVKIIVDVKKNVIMIKNV